MPKKKARHAGGNNAADNGNLAQPKGFVSAYSQTSQNAIVPTSGHNAQNAVGLSRNDPRYTEQTYRKKKRKHRIVAAVLVVVLLLVAGAGGALALYMNSLNDALQVDDEEEAAEIKEALTPTVSSTDPFYMLIVGSDSRGEENARSDTNILARVDPQNAQITLVSIPRDTAIRYKGSVVKFNAAYSYDGASGAIDAASELMGVDISHYVEVDFNGAIDLVDAIGGVTVDVPMDIDDEKAGGTISSGVQTLDGTQALVFARSRSYTTGDFQRTTNQRLLMEAVIEKVLSLPTTQLPSVVQQACSCISTDMSLSDIIAYVQLFASADDVTMYSAMTPSSTTMQDGVSYVVCDTTTLQTMMEVVDSGGDPSTVVVDSTANSSEEAIEKGQESYPAYLDE